MRSSRFVLAICFSEGQIKNSMMSWPCSAYGGQERCMPGFGGGNKQEGEHLEDVVVDGKLILKLIF
jgi:hypothetical protein